MLGSLGSGSQWRHEVDGRVFALPILGRARVELLEHALDVLAEDGGDLRLEVAGKTLDEVARGSAASVNVRTFLLEKVYILMNYFQFRIAAVADQGNPNPISK